MCPGRSPGGGGLQIRGARQSAQTTTPAPRRGQHHDAEGDAVPGEGHEAVRADVAAAASARRARRSGTRTPARPRTAGCRPSTAARAPCRGCSTPAPISVGMARKKREVGRRLARQAQQHAADDGRAAAAGARDHREALHQADLERVHGVMSSTSWMRTADLAAASRPTG